MSRDVNKPIIGCPKECSVIIYLADLKNIDSPPFTTRYCTACFFSTETKDDNVFQSLDQTETCTVIFLKGLVLAFMFTSVEIFPI